MSTQSLAAIRSCGQLRGNLKFTALELAHRLNPQGYGRVAYQMLAYATGYCRRTIITHVQRLVELGILQKTVYRTPYGYTINLYKLLLPPGGRARAAPATTHGASAASILPTPKAEDGKSLSLKEEIRRLRGGMTLLAPGSERYQSCLEDLQRLEAMQTPG